MKKIIFNLFIALFALTSCNDFLLREPELTQSNELTMSAFKGLNDATAGAYSRFQSYYWYGANFILTSELSGGNAMNPISYPGSGRYRIQMQWNYHEGATSSIWYYAYYTIAAANNVINNVEGKETPDVTVEDLNNIKAEALFLRALSHFDLVITFAQPYTLSPSGLGVPVILETISGNQPERNTIEETYNQIVIDLLEAESIMQDDYLREDLTDPAAGVSKHAIRALLSRVYLYMGKYQESANYATKIIDSGKYGIKTGDDYLAMFNQNTAAPGDEIIFEVYSSIKNSYWDGSGWEQMSYITSPADGASGSADVCASPDLINLFGANDLRLDLYEEKNSTDYFTLKYKGKDGSGVPRENNTIILRLSEMYLNRAEAILRGASIPGVTAQSDLDVITSNRGISSVTATLTSVLLERRKELAFEGHILYDLKRTGTSLERTDGGLNMPFPHNRWAFPIPKSEIEANPNMVQNDY